LIDLLISLKKQGIKLTPEDFSDLISDKKNIDKIIAALLKAKKEGITLSQKDIQNVFYSETDRQKLINALTLVRQEGIDLNIHQLKVIFLKNIKLNKFIHVKKVLKKSDLDISFSKLTEILSKNLNITKCIEILSKSKKSSAEELFKLGLFKFEQVQKLANVYAVEGKEKFKQKLSETILENGLSEDPKRIYDKLIKSKGDAFKINLEHIKNYISYDFEPDIDEINTTYIKARNHDLQIYYEQIVELAKKKVKISEFIDAQIKSGAYE
jgi:hypothetical protein